MIYSRLHGYVSYGDSIYRMTQKMMFLVFLFNYLLLLLLILHLKKTFVKLEIMLFHLLWLLSPPFFQLLHILILIMSYYYYILNLGIIWLSTDSFKYFVFYHSVRGLCVCYKLDPFLANCHIWYHLKVSENLRLININIFIPLIFYFQFSIIVRLLKKATIYMFSL